MPYGSGTSSRAVRTVIRQLWAPAAKLIGNQDRPFYKCISTEIPAKQPSSNIKTVVIYLVHGYLDEYECLEGVRKDLASYINALYSIPNVRVIIRNIEFNRTLDIRKSIGFYAQKVREAIIYNGDSDAHLIGIAHSMGGLVIEKAIVEYGVRIPLLITSGTAHGGSWIANFRPWFIPSDSAAAEMEPGHPTLTRLNLGIAAKVMLGELRLYCFKGTKDKIVRGDRALHPLGINAAVIASHRPHETIEFQSLIKQPITQFLLEIQVVAHRELQASAQLRVQAPRRPVGRPIR